MRKEAVLSGLKTGVWRWDEATDEVLLDAEAARLLGLPPEPVSTDSATVRACFHGVDYIELTGILGLALVEGTLAEARLRVVDERGVVLRVVRSRMRAVVPGEPARMVGTVQEIVDSTATSDWQLSREAFLLAAGRALAEARSADQVLRVAASLAMPGFTPYALALFGVESEGLRLIGHHGGPEGWHPLGTVPLDSDYPGVEAVRRGSAVYIHSPQEYGERHPEAWRQLRRPGPPAAWAYLPLVVAGKVIGVWMAAFLTRVSFTPDERSVLATVARMLGQALDRARAHESERELATGLQRSMMPAAIPGPPGFEVAARYVPTGGGLEIGGDWYDVIALPSGRTALVIGDVQGHDVRAASLMAQLRIAIRAYASEGHRPDAVLTRASLFLTELCDQDEQRSQPGAMADPRFATCLYMEADPATGALTVARAGHLDPAVVLADGTMVIRPTEGGLPLGLEPDPVYPITEHVLDRGETMLLCTDGLVETGGHDLYTGQARLQAAFQQTLGDGLEVVADALLDAVQNPDEPGPHKNLSEDDIALVLLRSSPVAGHARPQAERHMHMVVPQSEEQRVADARHQLRGMLHDWSDQDDVGAAELALSEMVANVLLHTDSTARVYADLTGRPGSRTLRMTIADSDGNLPHRKHPGEMASSGRGVMLLQELCGSWGVEPQGEGKAIWCEFYEK